MPREKGEQVSASDEKQRKHGKEIFKPAPASSLLLALMLE
jgi:hypothetical protein